jgi:hypothetical protein
MLLAQIQDVDDLVVNNCRCAAAATTSSALCTGHRN